MTKYKLQSSCRLDRETLRTIDKVKKKMEGINTKSEAQRMMLAYAGVVLFDDALRKKIEGMLNNGKDKDRVQAE